MPITSTVAGVPAPARRPGRGAGARGRAPVVLDQVDWFSLINWACAAEAALGLGDAELAAAAYEKLAPYAGRVASPGSGTRSDRSTPSWPMAAAAVGRARHRRPARRRRPAADGGMADPAGRAVAARPAGPLRRSDGPGSGDVAERDRARALERPPGEPPHAACASAARLGEQLAPDRAGTSCSTHGTSASTSAEVDALLKCSFSSRSQSSWVSSSWISAIASVSSCWRWSPRRSRAATSRTARARRRSSSACAGEPGEPGRAGLEDRVDLAVLGLHRLQHGPVRAASARSRAPARGRRPRRCGGGAARRRTSPTLPPAPARLAVGRRRAPRGGRERRRGRAGRRGASGTSSPCPPGPGGPRPGRAAGSAAGQVACLGLHGGLLQRVPTG